MESACSPCHASWRQPEKGFYQEDFGIDPSGGEGWVMPNG
jgi:hypothetical protein